MLFNILALVYPEERRNRFKAILLFSFYQSVNERNAVIKPQQ